MIGDMLSKIREDKNLSKTNIAKETNINVGHLTHIEKGERNPSHKALKALCDALNVPYQPIMYTYDKKLTQEQLDYQVVNHIKYDSVPMFDNLAGFASVPKEYSSASICLRVEDDSMSPKFKHNDYVFIELNTPLNNKDFGLFEYKGEYLIRKFIVRKNDLVLRAEVDDIPDIIITSKDNFNIIGKVLGKLEK